MPWPWGELVDRSLRSGADCVAGLLGGLLLGTGTELQVVSVTGPHHQEGPGGPGRRGARRGRVRAQPAGRCGRWDLFGDQPTGWDGPHTSELLCQEHRMAVALMKVPG